MSITKKVRFEVFKRDKFTCQYCGQQAPDVVLQVDHIHPKARGGEDDILNLITSCIECNQGKKDRPLSDDAVIKHRKRQLDLLQEKREQLEMQMEWQYGLLALDEQAVTEIADMWSELTAGMNVSPSGFDNLRAWVRKFGVNAVIEAMKAATSQYLHYDAAWPGEPTLESVNHAWAYIPRICACEQMLKTKPHMRDLFFLRANMKRRFGYFDAPAALSLLERAYDAGVSLEQLRSLVASVHNWSGFDRAINEVIPQRGE